MKQSPVDGAFGMSKSEMMGIWEEVKANQRKLDACPGPHDFSVDADPTRVAFKKWQCSKCGGEVNTDAKHWYDRGLSHGREHA